MHITAKSRYALKIMMDLASHNSREKRHDIAKRHQLSVDFMDHIMARLKRHGLVESIRGRNGGFVIGRKPESISCWDIFAAVEDGMAPVRCVDGKSCLLEAECISFDAWHLLFGSIRKALERQSLSSLTERWQRQHPGVFDASTQPKPAAPKRTPSTELRQAKKN